MKLLVVALSVSFTVTSTVTLLNQVKADEGAERIAPAARTEGPPRSAKLDLTPKSMATLHAVIRPHDHEWRHLRVHWVTDVVSARKKAAAQDKPIIVLRTGGAGYNEPLGTC